MNPRSFLLLRIPAENLKKEDAAEVFFAQLAEILKGKNAIISAEIVIYNRFLWFFITCPSMIKDLVKGQWYAQYNQAEVEEVKDFVQKFFNTPQPPVFNGCELRLDKTEFLPIKTHREIEKNPLTSFSGVAASFKKEEAGFIQLVLESQKKDTLWQKFLKKRRKEARKRYSGQEVPEYIQLEEEKEESPYFISTIRFLTTGKNPNRVNINLSSMLAVYKKILERPNLQKLKEGTIKTDKDFLLKFLGRKSGESMPGLQRFKFKFRLSPAEIATFFHLPYKEEEISQVVQLRSKRAPAPEGLPRLGENQVTPFGATNFQNEKISFGIKLPDRRRHLYIIGKTGMGKSKSLELLISSDIKQGKGVILMDPHGDLAREVLNMVPQSRINDVVYFDPSDSDNPIGFNPMEGAGTFEFRQNIVAGFISIFKKLFGLNWNERFEHVLRYTTLALLEYPSASVLGIPRMLTDNMFRQDVISYITDPLVKKFWTTEFSGWNDQFASQAIVPIINKIGQFVANPMIRNIVGQAKTGFSLSNIMNSEKILIANLSKGKLGEENSALLGSMLITKIWETAIARSALPEEERKDTFLYVDEFQNFATTTFANILSEARKYRLNLTVAHQYMQQLSPEVRATIFGNVGNMISFRVGGEDAQVLVKEYEPVFNVSDFLNLDIRNFLIKMSIDGTNARPFSGISLTVEQPEENNFEKIVTASRKKWSKPRTEVEREIQTWESGDIGIKQQGHTIKINENIFPEPLI